MLQVPPVTSQLQGVSMFRRQLPQCVTAKQVPLVYEGMSAASAAASAFIVLLHDSFERYWGPTAVNATMLELLRDQALCWTFSDLLGRPPQANRLEAVARLGDLLRPRMASFKWPDPVPWLSVA